jgi:hypothetical protein
MTFGLRSLQDGRHSMATGEMIKIKLLPEGQELLLKYGYEVTLFKDDATEVRQRIGLDEQEGIEQQEDQ